MIFHACRQNDGHFVLILKRSRVLRRKRKASGVYSGEVDEDDDVSPIEEVRLTVSNTDDPTQPIWTFRTWFLGLLSCSLLSLLNQIASYRSNYFGLDQIANLVITFPLGHFMAAVLPTTKFTLPGFGSKSFSFNPGPFNMKEHVLIAMFANAGSAFGSGSPYVMRVVNVIKVFYRRKISFTTSWLLILTTQVLFSSISLSSSHFFPSCQKVSNLKFWEEFVYILSSMHNI